MGLKDVGHIRYLTKKSKMQCAHQISATAVLVIQADVNGFVSHSYQVRTSSCLVLTTCHLTRQSTRSCKGLPENNLIGTLRFLWHQFI